MNRAMLKSKAKASLGGDIFKSPWLMGLLVCLIFSAINGALAAIPGVGAVALLIIIGPLTYGTNYIFLKQSRDGQPIEIGDMFKGFSEDFGQLFLIGFMTGLFTFLWSLLLIVPGIIKAYSYSMAYYIKADHPEMDWRSCMRASEDLMRGHKGELFVLQLSFIGWMFVGTLVCGIGTLWVAPYMSSTTAHFYNELVSNPQNA